MQKMGIINLTPDSFHAPSRAQGREAVLRRAEDLLERGCSILDLGAVSTRPGADEVSLEEEWRRLEPALTPAARAAEGLPRERVGGVLLPAVSVDTFRSEIVRRVYEEIGPFLVNDISAGEDDPAMLHTAAELGLPFVAMHKRGSPRDMDSLTSYPMGVTAEVLQYFRIVEVLGLQDNRFMSTIIGTSFDIRDILCYFVGCALCGIWEYLRYGRFKETK